MSWTPSSFAEPADDAGIESVCKSLQQPDEVCGKRDGFEAQEACFLAYGDLVRVCARVSEPLAPQPAGPDTREVALLILSAALGTTGLVLVLLSSTLTAMLAWRATADREVVRGATRLQQHLDSAVGEDSPVMPVRRFLNDLADTLQDSGKVQFDRDQLNELVSSLIPVNVAKELEGIEQNSSPAQTRKFLDFVAETRRQEPIRPLGEVAKGSLVLGSLFVLVSISIAVAVLG